MKHYMTPDMKLREIPDILMTSDLNVDIGDQYDDEEQEEE